MNRSKMVRRCVSTVVALGVSASVTAAMSPLVAAAPADVLRSVVAGATGTTTPTSAPTSAPATGKATTGDLATTTTDSSDLSVPLDQTINLAIDGLGTDGAPEVSFLRDALDLASRFLSVDTGTGVINLLDALLGGNTGTGNGSSLGDFKAISLPDFLKQLQNGVLTGDTTGVKPGEYTIKGTLTDPAGREVPVELTMTVGEPTTDTPGTDTPGTDTPGTDTPGTSEPTSTEPTSANPTTGNTGNTNTGNTGNTNTGNTGNTQPGTNDELRYADTEVKAGTKATVKPEGNVTGKTFVSTGNPDWVQVNPTTGEVTLAPTDGTAAGENEITVGYTTASVESLIASADAGKPDMQTTTFKANVTRDAAQSDAIAKTQDTASSAGSLDGSAGSADTGTGSADGSADTGTGSADTVAQQPASSNGSSNGTGGNGTASSSGQRPAYVEASQTEQLPVTGIDGKLMVAMTTLMLLAGAGAVFLGTRRANRA